MLDYEYVAVNGINVYHIIAGRRILKASYFDVKYRVAVWNGGVQREDERFRARLDQAQASMDEEEAVKAARNQVLTGAL
jgi:hypothetical protein